jgi:acetyl esterase/lipase
LCCALGAQPSVDSNVIFGMHSGLALLMDVHRPAQSNGFGVVVIPGSGWHAPLGYDARPLKESKEFLAHLRKLVDAGYTAFVITHRAAPRYRYPDAVEDAQRAVRFVRHHAGRYGVRADRIGALGGSSGGHLVNMLGTLDGNGEPEASDAVQRESAKVQCVVALYAPSDMAKVDTPFGSVTVTAFLGMRPPRNVPKNAPEARLYWEASPVNHVTPDDPPFLLLHGDADRTVPFQQSEIMEAALRKAGVPVKLIRVPGGGHGSAFPGAKEKMDWAAAALEWFETHLRGK